MCPRTAFSDNDYEVIIDGTPIESRDIESIKIIRQSDNTRSNGNMPVKGIVSSELIMTVRTADSFSPNAAVRIRVSGKNEMKFCPHFISSISRRGGLVTIRAFDRMRMTENDFDDSFYTEDKEPFDTSHVLGNIASQCGFAPCELSFPAVNVLYFKDIHGKKCREILDLLSEHGVGVWHCSDDEELRFTPLFSKSGSVRVNTEDSSPLYIHSEKGPFEAVYAKNTASGKVFSAGSTDDFRRCLKLSGRLFDTDRTGNVMSMAAKKVWRSFYCDHADISFAPCGLTEFVFGDIFGLIAVKTVIRFGGTGVYAQAQTADICEDESDYTDLMGYELRKKIENGRKYGSTVITEKGVGFTSDKGSDLRKADISFFSALGDRITQFDGAMIDNVMPDSIKKLSDTMTEFAYGNTVYRLSYEMDKNGEKKNIRLIKEEK